MGFYFRKSVSFGPVRLNFSKSGIGVSTGIKGARISTGPRGTYVHAGRNGFYYKQRIGGLHSRPISPSLPGNTQRPPSPVGAYTVQTASAEELIDSSSTDLVNQINSRISQIRFAPLAITATIILTVVGFLVSGAAFNAAIGPSAGSGGEAAAGLQVLIALLLFAPGALFSWQIHKGDTLKRTTPLFYELDQQALDHFIILQHGLDALSKSARVWRIETKQPTGDWKRNAGASALLSRTPATAIREQPPYIATNVKVWALKLNTLALYFLPDVLLVYQRGIYGAVSYDKLGAVFTPTRFIEEEGVPQDATVVDRTWRFVNKNGGPDRRFANNRELPIAQYGLTELQSTTGLNIHLHSSRLDSARRFTEAVSSMSVAKGHQAAQTRNSNHAGAHPVGRPASANATLGIPNGSSRDEIDAAYRLKVKMYHPDRLAALAPEFVELAQERMKAINTAYEELTH